MNITNKIGLPALLGQLAEECAELAQAALKLQRIEEGKNPTPVTREEALASILEEATDVVICLDLLEMEAEVVTSDVELYAGKLRRWEKRLVENDGQSD